MTIQPSEKKVPGFLKKIKNPVDEAKSGGWGGMDAASIS
jgi:hypothetical protein